MNAYKVIVIEVRRLEISVFAANAEEAKRIWQSGNRLDNQVVETNVNDVQKVG